MNEHNPKRLFYGSCFALITTAFSFSIRAGILPELGELLILPQSSLDLLTPCGSLAFQFQWYWEVYFTGH